jgi:hypothetical protein
VPRSPRTESPPLSPKQEPEDVTDFIRDVIECFENCGEALQTVLAQVDSLSDRSTNFAWDERHGDFICFALSDAAEHLCGLPLQFARKGRRLRQILSESFEVSDADAGDTASDAEEVLQPVFKPVPSRKRTFIDLTTTADM